MATRWGICGAGKICRDFCSVLKVLPDHKVVAVAASSLDKAKAFAADFDAPKSFGSYDDLANVDDIDVIYIGTINTLHVGPSLKYIEAGKNVLCEKPMSLGIEGCKKVISKAKEKGVLFVEGFWSRFFPVYDTIKSQIEAGNIGDVRMVQANFCADLSQVPRVCDLDLGGGSLMDIGVYLIQAANFVFKGKPEQIVVNCKKQASGADVAGVITLRYSGDRFASLTYNAETTLRNNFYFIRGTKGNLQVPDLFWCPKTLVLPDGERKEFEFPEVFKDVEVFFDNSQGFAYEAEAVRECLLKGWKESPKIPHEDSLTIMSILQECLNQMDIKYKHL